MSEPLILKRASASRPSSQWSDEHYDVLADGKVIGRIYEDASASTLPELRWFWSITEIVPAAPKVTNGHAATLDEAEAQVSRGTLPLTMPPTDRPGERVRRRRRSRGQDSSAPKLPNRSGSGPQLYPP
jgi:hypothetical protein